MSLRIGRRYGATVRARSRRRLAVERLEGRPLLAPVVAEFPLRALGGAVVGIAPGYGSDPNLYMTVTSTSGSTTTDTIGVYNPKSPGSAVAQYDIPTLNATPGDVVAGPDGLVYFLETNANGTGAIGVFDPKAGAVVAEYPILSNPSPGLTGITAGPDGNIWFTEQNANQVGVFNVATHAVTEFASPTPLSKPFGIAANPAGKNVWFTENGSNRIGLIDPVTHVIQDFLVNTGSLGLGALTYNAATGNLDFLETQAKAVGSFSPATDKTVSEVGGVLDTATTNRIVADGAGNDWFTEGPDYAIGELVRATGKVNARAVGAAYASGPAGIAVGSDGNLWYAKSNSTVGSFTTAAKANPDVGLVSTYVNGGPGGAVADNNGLIWFVDPGNAIGGGLTSGQIAVLDPATRYTRAYTIPTNVKDTPVGIALDALDGTIWYTEQGEYPSSSDLIGTIDPKTRVPREIAVPAGRVGSSGIAFDPKFGGDLWFAENAINKLAFVNPAVGSISDTPVPAADSGPNGVAVDGTGGVWVTMNGSGTVDRYDPGTGQWLAAPIALTGGKASNPSGITLGPDGKIWVVEGAGRVAVIDPATGKLVTEVSLPANGGIAPGPGDGKVWVTQPGAVASITPGSYAVATYPVANATPQGVAAGADGNLWFTASGTGYPTYYPNVVGAVTLAPAAQSSQVAFVAPPPPRVTVGKGFGLVVAVENSAGQVDPFLNPGNGSVTISLAGGPGALHGTLAAPVVNGLAVFTGLTVDTAGSGYSIQATFAGATPATSTSFSASSTATHLVVTTQPPAALGVGQPFTVTVSAEDSSGAIDPSYNGPVALGLTSSPAGGVLKGAVVVGATGGTATFAGLSVDRPGLGDSIQATAPSGSLTPVSTTAFDVKPGAATQLKITTEPPAGVAVGGPFGLTVKAEDASGYVDTNFNGPVTVAVAGGPAGSPPGWPVTVNAVAGVATFSGLSLTTAGTYTFAVSASGLASDTSTPLAVSPGAAVGLVMKAASSVTAGAPLSVRVEADDSYGNPVGTFAGTVHFAGTDPAAGLPADYTFTPGDGGAHTFSVTLPTAGTQTLSATDAADSYTASAVVNVNPGAMKKFAVSAPASATAGAPFSVTVTAEDAFGNMTPGYGGVVVLGSSDPAAVLPASHAFSPSDNGTSTFSVTLQTAGTQAVTASDSADPTVKGSAPVSVGAAGVSRVGIKGPASATTGVPFAFTVVAEDPFGNPADGYTGTVHFTSSDPAAVLPADYTFTPGNHGSHAFTATLAAPGPQSVTVADAGALGSTDTLALTVGASATKVGLAASASRSVYGKPYTFTATVSGPAGKPVPTGTVQFLADGVDLGAPVPLFAASATTPLIANLPAGTHSVTALYAGDGSNGPASSSPVTVTVAPAPLTVTVAPASMTYGQAGLPAFSPAFTGFVLGEGASVLGGALAVSTAAGPSSHVGHYPVTPAGLTSANYALTFAPGSLAVNPAPLTVAADDVSRAYGRPNPKLTYTVTGLVNGDTAAVLSAAPVPYTSAGAASPVGTYAVSVTPANLSASDYAVKVVPGVLTVTKAHLTLRADDKSKGVGLPLPKLTYTVTGLVNGDTPSVLSGAPALSTTATPSSPRGTYPIAIGAGTLSAVNYDVGTLAPGTLTVGTSAPTDFDGTGMAEPAVYRPSTGQWFAFGPSGGESLGTLGRAGDLPAPGDYSGSGKAQVAVYRPATGQWIVAGPSGPAVIATFGGKGDLPAPADYDGIGRAEPAVYRPSTGQWFVLGPAGGRLLGTFGGKADNPAPGDYDGIGRAEPAVYRPSTGQWFVLGPAGGRLLGTFGGKGDIAAPGDYDRMGKTEMAVYRPSTGQWFAMGPAGGHLVATFGAKNLVDVPADGPAALLTAPVRAASARRPVPTGPLAPGRRPGWWGLA